jgi:hypothetical protein
MRLERGRSGQGAAFATLSTVLRVLTGQRRKDVTGRAIADWIGAIRGQADLREDGPLNGLLDEIAAELVAEDDVPPTEPIAQIVAAMRPPTDPQPTAVSSAPNPTRSACPWCHGEPIRCPVCQPD